jgi:transmembrane sensor
VDKKNILITRFLTGEATPEEVIEIQKWLNESNDNMLYFRKLKNIWDNAENDMDIKKINVDSALNLVKKRIKFRSSGVNLWDYWKKIAAILIIPLVLVNLLYFIYRSTDKSSSQEPVYIELFAAFGTRSAIKLSDGTSVWLNSSSSLKYPDRFIGDKRTVFLQGEAYFEVESDLKRPFIVRTSSLTVKATGTKFNVNGYITADHEAVTLVSGKVEVSLNDDKENIRISKLNMNQYFRFNKADESTSVVNEDTYKYISWKDGKLVFRNEPLSNVVKRISQIYNIDIEIRGKELQNYSFRATFQDESLTEILNLLKISSPIDYFEVKRAPSPDGLFPRKKIIIIPARKL